MFKQRPRPIVKCSPYVLAWVTMLTGMAPAAWAETELSILPPLSVDADDFPLVRRWAEIPPEHLHLGSGVSRTGKGLFLKAGHSVRFLQEAGEEIVITAPANVRQKLVLRERRGPLVVAFAPEDEDGALILRPLEKPRWIEMEADLEGALQMARVRYEDSRPALDGRFRPLSPASTSASLEVTREDGTPSVYRKWNRPNAVTLSSPTLLRVETRRLVSEKAQSAIPQGSAISDCLLRIQLGNEQPQYVQTISNLSPFEQGKRNGEAVGIGRKATVYLTLPEPGPVSIESECFLDVQELPLPPQERFLDADQIPAVASLRAAAQTHALATFLKLGSLRPTQAHYRYLLALRTQLERDALAFKALYPDTLSPGDRMESLRGLHRSGVDVWDDKVQTALYPSEQLSDCVCVMSGKQRTQLSFSNPTAHQASWGRLTLPEAFPPEGGSYQILLKDAQQKTLRTIRFRTEPQTGINPSFFASHTFPVPAGVTTFRIESVGDRSAIPPLGLEVLAETETRLTDADVRNQLEKRDPAYLSALLKGNPEALPSDVQHRLKPLLQELRITADQIRGSHLSTQTFEPKALHEAKQTLMKEGSFLALRDLCVAGLGGNGEVRRVAQACLRDVLEAMEDALGKAVVIGWQYSENPTTAHAVSFAQALDGAGYKAEALVLLSALEPSAAEALLLKLLKEWDDQPLTTGIPVVDGYENSVLLQSARRSSKLRAYAPRRGQPLNIYGEGLSWQTVAIEVRRWSDLNQPPLGWIEATAGGQTYAIPALLQGVTPDLQSLAGRSLTYPAIFYARVRKDAPLALKGLDSQWIVRVSPLPASVPDLPPETRVGLHPGDSRDREFAHAFARIWQLEKAGKKRAATDERSRQIANLRNHSSISWTDAQRLRILEVNQRWMPVMGGESPSRVLRENFQAWSPDSRVAAVQKKLLPPVDEDIVTIVGSDEEDATEIELAEPAAVQVGITYHTLDEAKNLPQRIEMRIDEGPWQLLTLRTKDSSQILNLSAGQHRIALRFQEQGGQRFLFVKAAAKTDDQWAALRLEKSKYWAAGTGEKPLVVRTPGLFRIHERRDDRIDIHIKYRHVAPGERLTLGGKEGHSYRLYALTAAEDTRPPLTERPTPTRATDEPTAANITVPGDARPVYSVQDATAYSLALGGRTNCSGMQDGEDERGFCERWQKPDLAFTAIRDEEQSRLLARLNLFPGSAPLGHLQASYEHRSLSQNTNFQVSGSGFYGDNGENSLQGGSASVGGDHKWLVGPLDALSEVRFSLFETNRDDLHPDLPQQVISPWKINHKRTFRLGQLLDYRTAAQHLFRLNLWALSNPPGQTQAWDQSTVSVTWHRSWTPMLATGLGYEARYFFRDKNREKYTLRYSPRVTLMGLNYGLFRWPIITRVQVGLEPDSPRTVIALSVETPLGSQLNPDAESLRNFPFSDISRAAVLKLHAQ